MAGAKFSKGEEVEVTIPEEGFRGSWFSATVIRPVAKKNKMYVQYHSLLEEEGKSTKLKEYVNPFNVRPLPPRDTNRIFKLHDEVDAFYDDGWWEGDITRVVKEEEEGIEKFVVYFRASKEEMTFRPSELRIHREWINGSWKPPMAPDEHQGALCNSRVDHNKEPSKLVIKLSTGMPSKSGADQTNESSKFVVDLTKGTGSKYEADQANEPSKSGAYQTNESSKFVVDLTKGTGSKYEADQANEPFKSEADKSKKSPKLVVKFGKGMPSKFVVKFDNGTPVEVNSDEEGFDGAWFAATVVETIGENKFLVEHKNLQTDDLTEFLKEEVDSLHIRPTPPEILKDHYKKLEEVDALHNDAWWVGVISQVDNGPQPGYYVYFKNTGEELKYKHHELRPHQEWIKGEWVRPSEVRKKRTETKQTMKYKAQHRK